jgi:hypothetical protein
MTRPNSPFDIPDWRTAQGLSHFDRRKIRRAVRFGAALRDDKRLARLAVAYARWVQEAPSRIWLRVGKLIYLGLVFGWPLLAFYAFLFIGMPSWPLGLLLGVTAGALLALIGRIMKRAARKAELRNLDVLDELKHERS